MAGLKRNNPSLWGDCDHMVIHNPNPWTFTWIGTCTDPLGPTHCGWFQFQCPLNRARFLLGSFPLLVSFSLCIMNVVMVKMFRPLRGTFMTTKGKWCDVCCAESIRDGGAWAAFLDPFSSSDHRGTKADQRGNSPGKRVQGEQERRQARRFSLFDMMVAIERGREEGFIQSLLGWTAGSHDVWPHWNWGLSREGGPLL